MSQIIAPLLPQATQGLPHSTPIMEAFTPACHSRQGASMGILLRLQAGFIGIQRPRYR